MHYTSRSGRSGSAGDKKKKKGGLKFKSDITLSAVHDDNPRSRVKRVLVCHSFRGVTEVSGALQSVAELRNKLPAQSVDRQSNWPSASIVHDDVRKSALAPVYV